MTTIHDLKERLDAIETRLEALEEESKPPCQAILQIGQFHHLYCTLRLDHKGSHQSESNNAAITNDVQNYVVNWT